MWKRLLKIA
jgi:hypothetical protein